jgi:hypothetical protein
VRIDLQDTPHNARSSASAHRTEDEWLARGPPSLRRWQPRSSRAALVRHSPVARRVRAGESGRGADCIPRKTRSGRSRARPPRIVRSARVASLDRDACFRAGGGVNSTHAFADALRPERKRGRGSPTSVALSGSGSPAGSGFGFRASSLASVSRRFRPRPSGRRARRPAAFVTVDADLGRGATC